jgi:hypothetical protein
MKYALVFWGGNSRSKIIFNFQNCVTQIINSVRKYKSGTPFFKDLNIFHIHKKHTVKLEQNTAIFNHNTCQKLNLHKQFCRMCTLKKGVMIMGTKLYNILPTKIWKYKKQGTLNES